MQRNRALFGIALYDAIDIGLIFSRQVKEYTLNDKKQF